MFRLEEDASEAGLSSGRGLGRAARQLVVAVGYDGLLGAPSAAADSVLAISAAVVDGIGLAAHINGAGSGRPVNSGQAGTTVRRKAVQSLSLIRVEVSSRARWRTRLAAPRA